MKSYKALEIYQLSYELAIKIHKFSLKFLRYELFEEGSQIKNHPKGSPPVLPKGMAGGVTKQNLSNFSPMRIHHVMKPFCSLNFFSVSPNS
jgi:hypothetical protein